MARRKVVVLYAPDFDAYVLYCDVNADEGRGAIKLTGDRFDAKQFVDLPSAMDYWGRQSTVQPTRRDGKPNRPLSALTVEPQTIAIDE